MANQSSIRTTTVRLPEDLYKEAKSLTNEQISLNDVLVRALQAYLRAWERKRIDAAFASMGTDPAYQSEATAISRAFERSDWEALQISERDLQ